MSDGNGDDKKDPDVLTLRLVRASVVVNIEDESGEVQPYTLREMTGSEKGKWQTSMAGRMRWDDKGKPSGIRDWTGFEGSLICRCMFDADGKKVAEDKIKEWPTTVQKKLFEMCQKLNGLDEESEEKAKNG